EEFECGPSPAPYPDAFTVALRRWYFVLNAPTGPAAEQAVNTHTHPLFDPLDELRLYRLIATATVFPQSSAIGKDEVAALEALSNEFQVELTRSSLPALLERLSSNPADPLPTANDLPAWACAG
ncbi:MAG: hypothetical protein AAF736_18370, partial [Pseudomonadota bacterium]